MLSLLLFFLLSFSLLSYLNSAPPKQINYFSDTLKIFFFISSNY